MQKLCQVDCGYKKDMQRETYVVIITVILRKYGSSGKFFSFSLFENVLFVIKKWLLVMYLS